MCFITLDKCALQYSFRDTPMVKYSIFLPRFQTGGTLRSSKLDQDFVMDKRKLTLEERKAAINEAYEKKISQIDAQLKDISAREKTAARKRDTRRKIIMGSLAGFHMEKNPRSAFAKKLAALIDEYVIGDKERALFDLEPLPKTEAEIRREKHKDEIRKGR